MGSNSSPKLENSQNMCGLEDRVEDCECGEVAGLTVLRWHEKPIIAPDSGADRHLHERQET
jgi:hypothetical protein